MDECPAPITRLIGASLNHLLAEMFVWEEEMVQVLVKMFNSTKKASGLFLIHHSTKQVLDMNLKEKTMHTTTLLHTLSSVRLCPALVDFSNCQYCTKVSVFRHDNGIV